MNEFCAFLLIFLFFGPTTGLSLTTDQPDCCPFKTVTGQMFKSLPFLQKDILFIIFKTPGEPQYAGDYALIERDTWYFDAEDYPPNCRLALEHYEL